MCRVISLFVVFEDLESCKSFFAYLGANPLFMIFRPGRVFLKLFNMSGVKRYFLVTFLNMFLAFLFIFLGPVYGDSYKEKLIFVAVIK